MDWHQRSSGVLFRVLNKQHQIHCGRLPFLVALLSLFSSACGGEKGSSGNTSTTPDPVTSPFIELTLSYEAYQFSSTDVVPEYTYAGVTYPSAIADVFAQASLSEDFESDGYPEVIVPLNKAYGTPVYAALPYILLSNSNGVLSYRDDLNARLPSVFGARRSARLEVAGKPAAFFVAHNVSGIYNDPAAHGTAVLLSEKDSGIGRVTDGMPVITTREDVPDDGTDAHSMAVGDLDGDGLDDIIIGNWNSFGGFPPQALRQQGNGQFTISREEFWESLLSVALVNEGSEGNEGNNLLLDLHLFDANGDGLDDLVAGFGHGSTPSLLFLNENGTFVFENGESLPTSIYGIDTNLHLETRSADLDNDGDLDLLIQHSRLEPYYGGNYLQVLRNDDGLFIDMTESALAQSDEYIFGDRLNWSGDVFLRDLDNDGLLDILYGLHDGSLVAHFNKGSFSFDLLATSLPDGQGGRLLAVDDLDNDNDQELLYYQYGGTPSEKVYFLNVYEFNFLKP